VPYAAHDGVPSFRDSEIAGWFERLEAEALLRRLFFDGSVIYAADFVRLVKAPGVYFFTVWTGQEESGFRVQGSGVEKKDIAAGTPPPQDPGPTGQRANGPTDVEMAGVFWLRDFLGNAAFLHHAVFRKFWGLESRRIGRQVLEFVLGAEQGPPLVGTVLGLTPVNNVPALGFARGVGMERVGRIPGVFYDAYANAAVDGVMTCMTRERWVETRGRGFKGSRGRW
jgi:hypothetical protein